MTTETALNVRGRPPLSNRYGVGKRAGLSKAMTDQAGESSARRINHIAVMPKATENPSAGTGTYVWVNKTFADRIVNDYTDLGEDLVVFRKKYDTAGHYVDVNYSYSVNNINASATTGVALGEVQGGLTLDWVQADGYPGIAASYGTTNDVKVCMYVSRSAADAGGEGVGNQGAPTGFGPFVRGSGDLQNYIGACLLRVSDTSVKLAIIKVAGATRTTLYEQTIPITLDGTSWADTKTEISPNGFYNGNYVLCIRCWATSTTVTAELTWPGVVGDELDGSLVQRPDVFRISVNNSDYASNVRGGAAALFTASATPTTTTGDISDRWFIRGIQYQKYVPSAPDEAYRLTRAAGTITPPPERYYLPSTATGVRVTTAGTVTTFTGTSTNTAPTIPSLDTQPIPAAGETGSGFVSGGGLSAGSPGGAASAFIFPNSTWNELYAVETRGKDSPGTNSTEDIMGAAFRIRQTTSPYDSAILIEVKHTSDSYYARAKMDRFESMRVVQVRAGVRTTLASIDTTNANNPPFRSVHWHRWQDNGANGAAASVDLTWSMNGVTLKTWSNVDASWNAGTFDAPGFVVGCSFYGNNSAAEFTYAFGMRLVDISNSSATIVAETESRVAVFTTGYVDVGVLQDSDAGLTRCDGAGLSNPVVSTTVLGTKWYAADGLQMKVIDPEEQTVTDWVAEQGALPERGRLLATYRRSIVLARTEEDPTIWYLSRTDNPLDWDFGADPEATAPVAGNNGIVGQPADPINAVVAFDNDMMWFGCPSSIFQLEGDPRYGGQLQVLTRSTGIIGPRAWVFDGRGAMWFLGIDGLYRYSGGALENVSGSRLVDLIDHLDADSLFVQLAYDPYSKCVLIFRTPVDGSTVGTAIAFDTESNAFWLDQYPLEHGPWAVAQPFGSDPLYRRPLLGGNDGYMRWHRDSAMSDDGTAITTTLDVFVPDAMNGMAESMIERLETVLATGSGSVDWKWFTGTSPEAVAAATTGEVTSGLWVAGQNAPDLIRQTGASHKLRVSTASDSATWAIERINGVFAPQGERR